MTKIDGKNHPNQLVVEDNDTFDAVTALARHRIQDWPMDFRKDGAPVHIQLLHSAEEALNHDFLLPVLKREASKVLGVIVDADTVFQNRWNTIRAFAAKSFSDIPELCPGNGLIVEKDGKKFGAWIMPDNVSNGMLEDFVRCLVPAAQGPLWAHAEGVVAAARQHGADYSNAHLAKAQAHTYLALREPPGETIPHAIVKKILSPTCESADRFIDWFAKLYGLTKKAAA